MVVEGLLIMAIGIGMVLSFFLIIIFTMNMLGKVLPIVEKIYPEHLLARVSQKTSAVSTNDASIALAIAVAKRFTNK